ncbi:uncharacterized protein [Oryza sativa Japonica Group]|uniref:Os04g0685700 protein n=2 Tax=Oryza TaxID=4527 RepID=A0A0P0WGL9_ORYSJ|nr:uncharacterized protein LOC9267051 [Oryza sativa Japonica Group]KAF2936636.1 hypothetical protein DAI22_04g316600 [Oryza sativa Japonica Group]BAS91730.1 Os04g0685700 [Oryza sativa Japonica Group]
MGELASSPPPAAVLPVVFVDGDQTVDLGTVTVQPSLGVRKLQAVVADRVGLAPQQILASLARPRRARRVPLEEGTDLAAAVAREGSGCYVLAALRRSRRERRGGRSRREKKAAAAAAAAGAAPAAPTQERTILKRLPAMDLASLASTPSPAAAAMFGVWDYEAQLQELQRQREWYLMHTAAADPYFPLAPEREDPPFWSAQPLLRQGTPSSCPECEAAAAMMREPGFHWCVRDAVTVGFRSLVGPIERPAKKSPSPSPSPPPLPPTPGRLPPSFVGMMPVY